ncbi:unnamed protein product [Dovyalis caffra]|uniref:Uncharacterized protein n=1 Tax=Dovyalis caffra TaxID=77055 RepID=A0AAV1RC20_9ROSI|nr:unnamed protein product [Dovyalis caffra]
MEEEKSKKRPLDLDSTWDVIIGRDDGEPPPLVIVKNTQPQPWQSQKEGFASLSDKKLDEQIQRNRIHFLGIGPTLPDKGEKLRITIKAMEEERELRKLRRPTQMDAAECDKPKHSTASSRIDGFGQKGASSQDKNSQSQFTSIFIRKMEENTDCRVGSAYDKELTTLGHCNRQNMRTNGGLSQKRRQNVQSSSRRLPFQCATSVSTNGDRRDPANVDQKGRASSAHLSCHNRERFFINSSKKKDACLVLPSNGSRRRKGPTVVVLDEDEPQLVETAEKAKELAE